MKSTILALPLTLISLGSVGCAALVVGAGAGAGTYAYVTGKLTATLDAPLDKAFDATKAGLADLKFSITHDSHDALVGQSTSRMSDGTEVNIDLKNTGTNSTQITIRVGVFGDEAKSTAILDAIKKNLNAKS